MHWLDWMIVLFPLAVVLGLAYYSRRYVRGIADFLAAGRVAGRYVISVGDLQAGLAVISLVALSEQQYQCGMAVGFWGNLIVPLSIFMSLTGYVLYRYRQTKCLSMGQFLETRYNRPLRIVAATIRTIAEMMTNAIGPAVAARFFIYLLGFPLTVHLFGFEISTFALIMMLVLALALSVIWPGGRISLLVTDSLQGLMSYPIFVIFTVFVLSEISWRYDVAPVMLDRAAGESFLNPMDIDSLRDFNLFALVVGIIGSVLNRGAWIGNDTSSSGRTAHEQKMAGILGAWRNGFAYLMLSLLALFVVTIMQGDRFSTRAKNIRTNLVDKVAEETVVDNHIRQNICIQSKAIPEVKHTVGVDKPYSRVNNPDTPYLAVAKQNLNQAAAKQIAAEKVTGEDANKIQGRYNEVFQKFRTLYYQMMMPTMLRRELPLGMMGLFVLLMVMLMVSTDDSRIFNASSTLVQDVVMPFRKTPFKKKAHLWWLRGMSLGVCVFFFAVSLLFAQLDYINMFINIMCALWLGAAGPIMLGGLYTRWGTTTGAFGALVFGSGTSFLGLICQRNWAETIYPFLATHDYALGAVDAVFGCVTKFCSPLVVWQMDPVKFPINSFEIYFMAMMFGCAAYILGSVLTCRKPYNLDRMLHRGRYAEGETYAKNTVWTWRNVYAKLIGITDEYTKGDRIIAWSVFLYSVVFQFGIVFVGVLIWNLISPWPAQWWSWYFFICIVVVGIIVGVVSTVWFMIGGIVDLRRLFRDLAARIDNPLDDGWVEGHVSLADKALFDKEDAEKRP